MSRTVVDRANLVERKNWLAFLRLSEEDRKWVAYDILLFGNAVIDDSGEQPVRVDPMTAAIEYRSSDQDMTEADAPGVVLVGVDEP